jgi:two-component system nitrogen regulation response regulator NtrX
MGKFDLAHRGTLFLDEIGDMSLATQAKILRVLEEKAFQRVGGNRDISVDVRVVAATNKDLKAGIARGEFREDLFFRLNVFPFHLPPLRERREDIPQLLTRFLSEYGRIYSKPDLVLSPEAERILVGYSWPGNVRELRNVTERLAIISSREVIDLEMIPSSITDERSDTANAVHSAAEDIDYRKAREKFERDFFTRRLEENEWNISRTSEAVGLERSNLHRKIKQLGIRKEQ